MKSRNLLHYELAVKCFAAYVNSDFPVDPRNVQKARRKLDELWYRLTDEEKELAPSIPFRSTP